MKQWSAMMVALESIGFDTKAGMATTGGNEAFYLELVADFRRDYLDRIGGLRREDNIASLAHFTHDLKSVLRTLGEFNVARMTEEWESAIRNNAHDPQQQARICDALDRFSQVLSGLDPT